MDNSTTQQAAITANRQNFADYNFNRNAVSIDDATEECRQHSGQLVARSLDGVDTFAYANSYDEIFKALEERKIPVKDAVVSRVADWDEASIF